jgi:thiol-disulfide isomerase/thioredoxin
MERTEDFRLTSTPRSLIIACLILLVLRIGLAAFEWQHPAERGRPVNWTDAAKYTPAPTDKDKPRLYEFYAAWCNPCERLEHDVMTNDEIEQNFVPLRVVDRQKEDGKNSKFVMELQKRYRIFAFPTLVAVDVNGEPIGLLVGNSSSLSVYRFLSRAQADKAPKH